MEFSLPKEARNDTLISPAFVGTADLEVAVVRPIWRPIGAGMLNPDAAGRGAGPILVGAPWLAVAVHAHPPAHSNCGRFVFISVEVASCSRRALVAVEQRTKPVRRTDAAGSDSRSRAIGGTTTCPGARVKARQM